MLELEFDPDKRERTIAERGLDMARANEIFERTHVTFSDDRAARRIISLRKANGREQAKFTDELG